MGTYTRFTPERKGWKIVSDGRGVGHVVRQGRQFRYVLTRNVSPEQLSAVSGFVQQLNDAC